MVTDCYLERVSNPINDLLEQRCIFRFFLKIFILILHVTQFYRTFCDDSNILSMLCSLEATSYIRLLNTWNVASTAEQQLIF